MKHNLKLCIRLLFPGLFIWLQGCAQAYFHPVENPPIATQYSLDQWPYDEYWTGIIFNGEKIGFTHLSIEKNQDGYEINSQAIIQLNFLGVSKEITLNARDHIADDLQIQSFKYDYIIDDSRLMLEGARKGNTLKTVITQNNQTEQQDLTIQNKLYPTSVIGLYPVLHGLVKDRRYTYQVYDGETRSMQTVKQVIDGYESSELFSGNAWRIETTMLGQNVTTWINDQGLPVFELSLHGVMISALESEDMSKRYLASGVLNKQDALLNFSLVPVQPALTNPRQTTQMEFIISGIPDSYAIPVDTWQHCKRVQSDRHCTIQQANLTQINPDKNPDIQEYLVHTIQIPVRYPTIQTLAKSLSDNTSLENTISNTLEWLNMNIQKEITDSFSALDVLEQRKAECQGHSMLYTALTRAQNIPTKIVNGLVYSEQHQGFLYHTWSESLINNQWIPIDPTFNQFPADATHIKLVEGDSIDKLVQMLPLIGQIHIQIMSQQ